ncbi:hypothetical protein T069G_08656 [Trichoderma breve]|uniref:DUF6546 domain-containing protein n=1 Tax=Trichoderma breve TaxID=2034170 RepID=A0A9W9B874_9HYPO|nr:hypothetical protein T069G_08656 [Trichoderma breve]KAJ4857759.1 hypothetical protein T069G_08656 [Trichoderma breve]
MAPVLFPPEIFQQIISYLIHDPDRDHPLSHYASVSRVWQNEIEPLTFALLHLDLQSLLQLNSIVTARRRAYVRHIRLRVKLPKPEPWSWKYKETADEKLRNNQAFQAVLEAFLQSLSQWDVAEGHKDGVEVTFFVPLPRKGRDHPLEQWRVRYIKSVLEMTDPGRIARLPSAATITKLEIPDDPDRERLISVVAVCALLAKLPAATEKVRLYWWKADRFARMRNDLADALSQISHPIDDFDLRDSYGGGNNQTPTAATEVLMLREGEEDRLSKSLHVVSQRVTDFGVRRIPVSDEILFPRTLPASLAEPRWDRLVYFGLYYQPYDPWGEPLFLPDPNADDSISLDGSEASFWATSSTPSAETERSSLTLDIATPAIQRLYLAAARAALQMPVLKEMELVAELEPYEYWHGFRYFVHQGSATATWTSSSGFVPEDEVLEHWHKVPKKNLQLELNVVITDDRRAV